MVSTCVLLLASALAPPLATGGEGQAVDAASDSHVRTALVQVISEYRSAEGVPFLEALLRDHHAEIWKSALDGLVMVGGQAALDALGVAKTTATPQQREWIDEAVGQIIKAHRPA